MASNGQCRGRVAEVGASLGQAALAEIYNAEDKQHALAAVKALEADFGTSTDRPSGAVLA